MKVANREHWQKVRTLGVVHKYFAFIIVGFAVGVVNTLEKAHFMTIESDSVIFAHIDHFKLPSYLISLLFFLNIVSQFVLINSLLSIISWITLHYGITAHLCPWQGSVPILPPNSQKTLPRERLTNAIVICRLTPCQNYNRSSCFSKGGTVDTLKLGRCLLENHFEITVSIILVVSDSCGASTQILMKPASLWSEACGPTTSRHT